jgi:membrane protease YdiL (CAAX protease family)
MQQSLPTWYHHWVIRWWLWLLGYVLLPITLLQWLIAHSVIVDNSTLYLLLLRLLLLIGIITLLPQTERGALQTLLTKCCTYRQLIIIALGFTGLVCVGILCFSWVESLLKVTTEGIKLPKTIAAWVLVGVLAPIIEEGWFRYWLLALPTQAPTQTANYWQKPHIPLNWVWSTLIFGLLHANPTYTGIKGCIWAWIMGGFLVWVRYKTNSLSMCIALHAIHNTVLLGLF